MPCTRADARRRHNFSRLFREIMLAAGVQSSAVAELRRLLQHPGPLHTPDYLVAVLFKVHRHKSKHRLVEEAMARTTTDALHKLWPALHERRPQLAGDQRPLGIAEFLVTFPSTAQFFGIVVDRGLPVKGAVLAAAKAKNPAGLEAALGKTGSVGLPYDDDYGGPGTPQTVYGKELDAALYSVAATTGKVKTHLATLTRALVEAGADPTACLADGITAFMRAVAAKNIEVAEALAELGYAGPAVVERTGQTLYHLAVSEDQEACRRMIALARRVDPEGVNRVDHCGNTALVAYICSGAPNGAVAALLDAKADPAWYLQQSPLEAALARTAHERMGLVVQLLLAGAPRTNDAGVDIIDASGDGLMARLTTHLRGHPLERCAVNGPWGDSKAARAYVARHGTHGLPLPRPSVLSRNGVTKKALLPWAPARHALATPNHRRTITTVLLVAQRLQSALPREMWLEILGFTQHDPDAFDAVTPGTAQQRAVARLRCGKEAWSGDTTRSTELRRTRVAHANALLCCNVPCDAEAYLDALACECFKRIEVFGKHRGRMSSGARAILSSFVAGDEWEQVDTIVERIEAQASRHLAPTPHPTLAYIKMRRAAENASVALTGIPDSRSRVMKQRPPHSA